MALSYNTITNTTRLPLAYIEFDNSGAVTGTPQTINKTLMLGLRLSSGNAPVNAPVRVTNSTHCDAMFGEGSMLSAMAKAFLKANSATDLYALALDDNPEGVPATGSLKVTGAATGSGQITLMIAGMDCSTGVKSGTTAADLSTLIVAKINDNPQLPVTAALKGDVIEVTARWNGETGNDIDMRINYYDGETLPDGIAVDITAMTGGTGNPDLSNAVAALGDVWWNYLVNPFTNTRNLDLLRDELVDRFGGMRQIDGLCWQAFRGTHGQATAFGTARNDHVFCTVPTNISPEPSYIWASVVGAVAVGSLNNDPARPLQTLTLTGIKPPASAVRWSFNERNLHLYDGISACTVDAGGNVMIERLITMYRVNAFASPDPSYLDVETIATLSYLRYAIRTRITQKFPRHKLADDGTRFGAGQPIVTPAIIRNELLALFTELEQAGLVENFDNYKSSLIVERDANDRNRINVLSHEDLVNQFRVYAHQIGFIL